MDYKALTYVNLPFLDGDGRLFSPGDTITDREINESADLALEAMPDNTEHQDGAAQIAELVENGSISDDMNAPLHPDHQAVPVGVPTVAGLAQQARQLIAQMEAEGEEVPPDLAVFAEAIQNIEAGDVGKGGTKNA